MDNKGDIKQRIKDIKEEYKFNEDIFNDDDKRAYIAKKVIFEQLNEIDRTIILLYTETGSLRQLGKILGCSHSTIRPEVNRIKEDVKEKINKLWDLY